MFGEISWACGSYEVSLDIACAFVSDVRYSVLKGCSSPDPLLLVLLVDHEALLIDPPIECPGIARIRYYRDTKTTNFLRTTVSTCIRSVCFWVQ